MEKSDSMRKVKVRQDSMQGGEGVYTEDGANLESDAAAGPDAAVDTAGSGDSQQAADTEQLRTLLAQKEQEARDNYDRYLRALADMDNVRKRMRQEQDETKEYANANLILQFLPILDNFELALKHSESSRDFEALLNGVHQILKQMKDTLARAGVEPIASVGTPFDPEQHEAIGYVASDEHEPGNVAQDLRTGYRMRGRTLRPSLVRVAGE
jgi:molecular chaperone GrpE